MMGGPGEPRPAEDGRAHTAWERLREGNARFAAGVLAPRAACATVRERLRERQRPFAAVLCCSDSRVAPELIFDLELGDIFVVRTAGHVVDEVVEATLHFGIVQLSIPLVVVLGHAKCAAVALVAGEAEVPSVLARAIEPAVRRIKEGPAAAGAATQPAENGLDMTGAGAAQPTQAEVTRMEEEHVLLTVERLNSRAFLRRADVLVTGGRYDLAGGEVSWLSR